MYGKNSDICYAVCTNYTMHATKDIFDHAKIYL